ncbi:olfactory receptor 57 [Bombyx mori]|uniref:Odorant receptor n=1 Tax=Bombyx mori TaxID=7091 RepID=C7SFP3_BOMMO|nr:olfactory receptor 57 [Bombyx mori]ACH73301.1 olfactory receptor 50 [Bombyx mori]
MPSLLKTESLALTLTLNTLSWAGLILRDDYTKTQRIIMKVYGGLVFLYLFVFTAYVQIADLVVIWGNIDFMTETSLILFMQLAVSAKVLTLMLKSKKIMEVTNEADAILNSEKKVEGQRIIASIDKNTTLFLKYYGFFVAFTIICWFMGENTSTFFIRSKYPFNELKSPGREFAFVHQCIVVIFTGSFDFNVDIIIISLVAVCRCRLKLVALSLRNLCLDIPMNKRNLITSDEEKVITERLRNIISQHKRALDAAEAIKHYLSGALLVQLMVSIVVICTTAYQLAVKKSTTMQSLTMAGYLFGTSLEVFLFCYQGEFLRESSEEIADAAYECPWYTLTRPLKKTLLIIMTRAQRPATLTAGGFVTLDITEYMAIMKASYSFFTVLQQVSE